jgi:hypothetical protein
LRKFDPPFISFFIGYGIVNRRISCLCDIGIRVSG